MDERFDAVVCLRLRDDSDPNAEDKLAQLRLFVQEHGWEISKPRNSTAKVRERQSRKKTIRPRGRPRVVLSADEVVGLRDNGGCSWPEIGRKLHAGATTVRRAYKIAKSRDSNEGR